MSPAELDAIVEGICRSKKYQGLARETVRDVLALELSRQKSPARAVELARRRLHRLWAQFLGEPEYESSKRALDSAFVSGSDHQIRSACETILTAHASARERMEDVSRLYSELFAITGRPARLLDLACALNPLSFRWMDLPGSTAYHAFDINERVVGLANHYFRLEGLAPLAELRDVLCRPFDETADVALLLKMYHCLEHRRRGAGWQVVEQTHARWIALSFPTRNLTNRDVDILENYEPDILDRAKLRGWHCARVEVPSEIVLLIERTDLA
jgi:16S rRNA (guanine(1405)-N(7))-methyltransferase